MTPAAVLFDCDGVIADSEPATFGLLVADLAARGLPLSHEEAERLFLGGSISGCAKIAASMGADIPEGWVADFYEKLYAHLAVNTPLIEGIEDVLDALDAASIPYAIGSNGSLRKMGITLGQHPALYERFAGRIFSGEDLGILKPKPDLYLHAARALNADPARCAVIEDSATGARAAVAAGMRCMGYAPDGVGAALKAEGAETFTRMADLPGRLGL